MRVAQRRRRAPTVRITGLVRGAVETQFIATRKPCTVVDTVGGSSGNAVGVAVAALEVIFGAIAAGTSVISQIGALLSVSKVTLAAPRLIAEVVAIAITIVCAGAGYTGSGCVITTVRRTRNRGFRRITTSCAITKSGCL